MQSRAQQAEGNQAAEASRVFDELLEAESNIDMTKLCEASLLGIPSSYRGTVYLYLLGVSMVNKSSEMSVERLQEKDFEMLLQSCELHWRTEGGAGCALRPKSSSTVPLITELESRAANMARGVAVGTLDSHAAWEKAFASLRAREPYRSSTERYRQIVTALGAMRCIHLQASLEEVMQMVALALPLDDVCASARDTFFCTRSLYQRLRSFGNILQDDQTLQAHCGRFLMLFRAVNPALCRHFTREGVTTLDWVPGMLTTLLAGRLHPQDTLRLWDYYFASGFTQPGFPLHPYVVLALLADLTEELIEAERTEVLHRLQHLPRVSIPGLIRQATSIQELVYTKDIL